MTTEYEVPATGVAPAHPAQRFAVGAGIVYAIFGVVGFAATGLSHFASLSGHQLLVFGVDPLQNLVHLVAGGLWLAAARRFETARLANVALGLLLAVVTAIGFAGLASFLAIEPADADNFLHLATAALAIYFGTVGAASLV